MVDVIKAFDRISHNVLSNGLWETSLPEQIMLNNTVAGVVFNNTESEYCQFGNGT